MSSPSTTLHAKQGAAAAPVSRARTILAGSVGNAVEWFDWTIYASFAIFFSSQFFPEGNETTAAGLVRHLRGRLLHAPGGRLAAGHFLRPLRPRPRWA